MFSNETLSILRYVVSRDTDVPAITDWQIVIDELRDHAILPILIPINKQLSIPEEIDNQLKVEQYQHVSRFVSVMHAQQELTNILEKQSVLPMILKGIAAAQYYDYVESRTFGDIDILITDENAFNVAVNVLLELGYLPQKEYGELTFRASLANNSRHFEFNKNSIEVELHSRYTDTGSPLENLIHDTIPTKTSIKQWCFYCLPDIENGLTLLQHVKFHMNYDGVGLRLLLDWAYYVKTVLSDDLWNNHFENLAEKCGLKKLAECLTKICEKYFGLERHLFAESADEEICELFFQLVYESGNFGRKRSEISKKTSTIKKGNVLQILQNKGSKSNEKVNEHISFRLLAWIRGFYRYIVFILRRKKGIISFADGLRYARINERVQDYFDNK